MATEKQVEYIQKLEGWKAVEPKSTEAGLNAMSEEEASAYIDELKELKSVKKRADKVAVKQQSVRVAKKGFSAAHVGLITKMVYNYCKDNGLDFILSPDDELASIATSIEHNRRVIAAALKVNFPQEVEE